MLYYVVSNLIFNEKLKSATHSIEEIEHVCMLDVMINGRSALFHVSVEMTKVNALNKGKTVLLSCFKLGLFDSGKYSWHPQVIHFWPVVSPVEFRQTKFKKVEIWNIGQMYFESFHWLVIECFDVLLSMTFRRYQLKALRQVGTGNSENSEGS